MLRHARSIHARRCFMPQVSRIGGRKRIRHVRAFVAREAVRNSSDGCACELPRQTVTMKERYFEYGEKEIDHLRKRDKKLGAAIDRIGMIRRAVNPDLFAALAESVVGQQISSKAAQTVCGRLGALCGMDSGRMRALSTEEIQACGMSMRKAGYLKSIAEAAASKAIDFAALHDKSDEEIARELTALKGVGQWTAEMLLIFSLARPDVVSYGDLAIRRGMMRLYRLGDLPKEKFARYAKRYSPYGSVASLYLWQISTEDGAR